VLDQVGTGALAIDLIARDYERVEELLHTYADLKVGVVDCAVLAVVERLAEPKLATLDHRHFGVMRLGGLGRRRRGLVTSRPCNSCRPESCSPA
jgi:hypothetical protein